MDKNSINFRHHTLIITILIQFNQFCFSLHNEDKLPLILGWNDFFDAGNLIETIGPKEQSFNRAAGEFTLSPFPNSSPEAAAIIFHANGLANNQSWPNDRRPEQLFVFFSLESPYSAYGQPAFPFPYTNYFNLSMTYRPNDALNLQIPYGGFRRLDEAEKERRWFNRKANEDELKKVLRHKKKLLLQIVSNCETPSGRKFYTDELGKYVNVTKYGKCFGNECNRECYHREMSGHFFYLAFENSVCLEYVTEKFWNALTHRTVPIVLSRAMLDGLDIPKDAFIAADDFSSPKELAKYLLELQQNPKQYLRFFNWTDHYSIGIEPRTRAICRLCEMAHQKDGRQNAIVNIYKYWDKNDQCIDFYAKMLLKR